MRSGDLGDQNWSCKSSFPRRPIHRWGGNSLRKRQERQERQETWGFRRLHFPAGRSSTPLASECSTFPEWISTSTMDRLHGEWRLGTSVLAPRSPDLTPCDFFLWELEKDAVYVPPLATNLNDLRNRITAAVNSVTQDIRHRLGWIQLPCRCYPCSRRGSFWTSVNLHVAYV